MRFPLPMAAAIVLGAATCDNDEEGNLGPATTVELANHSVTPALLKGLPAGVEVFSLISSDDVLSATPTYVFGGSADGAGLLQNSDGTWSIIVNHEDNFAVSRVTLDATFEPTGGEYILNSTNGRWRLCSATLATPAEHGFGPLFLTVGESGIESQIHALSPSGAPNSGRLLNALGKWNSENAVPLPTSAYAGKTVIIIGDDDSGTNGGQVAQYVSNTVGDLDNGSLYVLARVDNNTRERDMVLGQTYQVEFRPLASAKTLTGAQIETAGLAVSMLQLGRTEDLDYRKGGGSAGREIYFNTTGQATTGANADFSRTKYGRVYKLVLSAADPLKGTLEVILDGDVRPGKADKFQNPDNIMVTENYAYIQEDANGYGDETHDAYLYQYNLSTGALTVVAELDHRRGDAKYNLGGPSALGGWEYGAMIDISDQIGIANTFLLAIQPHTWLDDKFKGVDGGTLRPNERQGSQLLVLRGLPRLMPGASRLAAGLLLSAAAGACGAPAGQPLASEAAGLVHFRYLETLDSLRASVAALADPSLTDPVPAFHAARAWWKRIEFLAEYYNPGISRGINGPALDRVEEDDPNRVVLPPEGFQVIEELLFPAPDPGMRPELAEETGILLANVGRLGITAAATPLVDGNIFDAARQELARVVALGVSGFDSPVVLRSLPEAIAALDGIRELLGAYARQGSVEAQSRGAAFDRAMRGAIAALDTAPDFASFDRLAFITDQVTPAARQLTGWQEALGIARPPGLRNWSARADTPWDRGALDPGDFAAAAAARVTPLRAALGERLFHDPVLSGGRTRTCASCHEPARAFSDGRVRARPVAGSRAILRNTPTIVNAGFQLGSFYDLRVAFLDDQVGRVIESPDEMHGSLPRIADALSADESMRAAFGAAFGDSAGVLVTPAMVRAALASYVRSLAALEAPADQYLHGDRSALGDSAIRGFNLFMGKARCGTCHFFPLTNGTVPPAYVDADAEVLGVPATARPPHRLDPDSGRARVIPAPLYLGAMKTVTVRNVALTAPYMHNGVFRTLEEVVDFYDAGGGAGLGLEVPNQTLPSDSLRLTPAEKRDLVSYMHALTDTSRTGRRGGEAERSSRARAQ